MENAFKCALLSLLILPMILMLLVVVFSTILVISDIPFRD